MRKNSSSDFNSLKSLIVRLEIYQGGLLFNCIIMTSNLDLVTSYRLLAPEAVAWSCSVKKLFLTRLCRSRFLKEHYFFTRAPLLAASVAQ